MLKDLPEDDPCRFELVAVRLATNNDSILNLQVLQRRIRAVLDELG
jgi:hypothetical protein